MRRITIGTQAAGIVLAIGAMPALAGSDFEFEKPVRLEADGSLIDVDVGHAAPYVYDFDGDGVRDLLVGQFGEGKLRIYRNTGTDDDPEYAPHEWFVAGGVYGTVPAS